MQESFFIKRIAVLGAGVMGAQIAAHCVNAGFETLLFDLEGAENNRNAIVDKAIANLIKLKPSPLATPHTAHLLKACNYGDHLTLLSQCDLIIEAIAERMDWKSELYQRIAPMLTEKSIVVSNTSGLTVNALVEALPAHQRQRFCGVHFFNPPRYMHLAELIPAHTTSMQLLDYMESWLTRYLGKGVVRAKDTPNFIANRIGVFSLLVTLYHAKQFNLGLDEVDALTGPILGRPKSATFRTMDVVGLDTMQHVVRTMQQQLINDPWHAIFKLPEWLMALINQGHLGQKTGQGIYRKNGKAIEVYDIAQQVYRTANGVIHEEVHAILRLTDPALKMQRLIESPHPQAQFLSACFRDLFHYSAYHLEEIADTTRDVDLALRWGFGWQNGPFELWQTAGLAAMRRFIESSITQGLTINQAKLPAWLNAQDYFYTADGAYSPSADQFKSTSHLPVYQRQIIPDAVLGLPKFKTDIVFENEGVCLSHLKDEVLMIHFKSKANTIGQAVIDGFLQALDIAEAQSQGLVIYQKDSQNFSSGADLRAVAGLIKANKMDALESMVKQFQHLAMRLKYSVMPTIAALRGRALGGGCELLMQCSAVVCGFESYPGLVEMGVGLIPAGGGCKEMAMRAASKAKDTELMSFIRPYFEQIATGFVASSAPEALLRGYLRDTDTWVMHSHEVLYAAMAKIKAMQATNYLPPQSPRFNVAGREGHAQLQAGLVNWLEGGYITQHDYLLANELARVLCGGEVNQGTVVNEDWMLNLERKAFMTFAAHPLTQLRIEHLLETGKPLRN